MRLILIIGILAAGITACSKQNWYQGVQSSQKAHCMKEPLAEYEECIRQSNESYDSYSKNQEELAEDPATNKADKY